MSVWGEDAPPEENMDLPDFTLDRAHLLLQEVYGDFPHHNDGLHLDSLGLDSISLKCLENMNTVCSRMKTMLF